MEFHKEPITVAEIESAEKFRMPDGISSDNSGSSAPLEGFVEFCFQFDDEEPVVFANGKEKLEITMAATENHGLEFRDASGKKFRIFPRPMQATT